MRKLNFIYASFLTGIILAAAATAWLLATKHPIGAIYTGLAAVIFSAALIALINKHFRLFRRLLLSIADEDFSSLGFPKNSFTKKFSHDLNRAFKQYKERELNNRTTLLSYEMLLDKTETAFIIAMPDGSVDWMNKAAVFSVGNIAALSGLDKLCSGFSESLAAGKPGETFVVQFSRNDTQYEMAVSTVQMNDRLIISLQNIHSVLEANELIAWQRLISVLTHEIMNSLTPIISLSDTLMERVQDEGAREALSTIRRRSTGLQTFVENYRRITRVPLPTKTTFRAADLFSDIKSYFPEGTVSFSEHNPGIRLTADRSQLEQVFINLVKNALEAESTLPISATVFIHPITGNSIITISDHGLGIAPEVLEKIFIPFFSTKPSGSGIGLSLCKQIISLHGGSITASSEEGKGTTFRISLP